MTEMEELVARALALAHKDYHAYARPWALLTKSSYGEDARAAIAAMKEPADPGIPVYRLRDGTEDVLGEG